MKNYRLSSVAREFNVGTNTIVEFLAKKNFLIVPNPNSKINEEMYELLVKQFSAPKSVKGVHRFPDEESYDLSVKGMQQNKEYSVDDLVLKTGTSYNRFFQFLDYFRIEHDFDPLEKTLTKEQFELILSVYKVYNFPRPLHPELQRLLKKSFTSMGFTLLD